MRSSLPVLGVNLCLMLASVAAGFGSCPALAGEALVCINADPQKSPALAAGARETGLTPSAATLRDGVPAGRVLLLEVRGDIDDRSADALGDAVRRGTGLLLTMGENAGMGAMRLAFMLPTTAWMQNKRGPISLSEADGAFFGPADAIIGLTLPWHREVRPFHAAERGQDRYAIYERPVPFVRYTDPGKAYPMLPPGSYWWTRPLLNREWQVRAWGGDLKRSPILLTGRYGAGRVAVFPSSVEGMAESPATNAFWASTLRWLAQPVAAAAGAPGTIHPPVVQTDRAARLFRVIASNPTDAPLPVVVLARLLTWERAPIGDVQRELTIPAGDKAVATFSLPKPDAASYQALDARDAYCVRVGVLSKDGASLLAETVADVDLRPDVQLAVATDEIRTLPYPFSPGAPKPGLENRLGLPISTCSCKPGQTIHVEVTAENGLRNLAPMAVVADLTTPGNKSVVALTDGAARGERGPDWFATTAYGQWEGDKTKDNVLEFTFPREVTLCEVVLVGSPDNYRNYSQRNPHRASVEVDGKQVAADDTLKDRPAAECARISLRFDPVKCKALRLHVGSGNHGLWLGEVELLGTIDAPLKPFNGKLHVSLHDPFTGESVAVASTEVAIAPLGRRELRVPITLPDSPRVQFYRIDARLIGDDGSVRERSIPVMAIDPKQPLESFDDLKANAIEFGFIVTRGFRNIFDVAVGTAEIGGGWGQPDDLVWAYAHGFKQIGQNARTQANRLYVTENDARHYSTPWRQFCNGEEMYDVGTPMLVERAKKHRLWGKSDLVLLGHSDRWDTGPDMGAVHAWQDFEGFNDWLLAEGKPGLKGITREELANEIHREHEGEWYAWHLARYVRSVRGLRDAFAREGKRLLITAQGAPLVPTKQAEELCSVIRGMNDDNTWGMADESIPLTTGRQMGMVALNPCLAMKAQNSWGWNSNTLGNPQWRGPVGTTEPSRRHLYDRAFRGFIRPDGSYAPMSVYGYGNNGGLAYTLNANDYEQWYRVQEKHSLLTPDAPFGAGLVISTAHFEDPANVRFTAGDGFSFAEIRDLAEANRRLQAAGVAVSFSANAACLAEWRGEAPLVILNLHAFGPQQVKTLEELAKRDVPMAAFSAAGTKLLHGAAELFGVTPDGEPADGEVEGKIDGRAIVRKEIRLFIPISAGQLTEQQAQAIAPLLKAALRQRVEFPEGTSGYGFASNGRTFIVVEDWAERGRTAVIRLRAEAHVAEIIAVDANEHRRLAVRRDGADWLIELPTRPGDGNLICIEEVTR